MGTNSTKCAKEYSREPDMVLDDNQSEGELPTQDQAPLDIKNLGDPSPRPGINSEETTRVTPEVTGPGAQALDQMAPIEDIADICIPPSGDPSLREEGTISLPLSLSSLDDKVTYRPPANNAGGDSFTQEVNAMDMEREKLKYEGEEIFSRPKSLSSKEDEVGARAPDELSQVTKRSISNTSQIDQIKKRIVSQSVRVNNYCLKYYEMLKSMNLLKRDNNNIKIDVVSLKSENYDRKRESDEIKREMSEIKRDMSEIKRENHEIKREYMYSVIKRENSEIKREYSALKSENVQLKIEMFKLKQAHHNDPIAHETMRNDSTTFQKEVMSPRAALNASVFQDDDKVHDDTVCYTGGIDIPK
ncbi:uncharacterized protein LOC105437632 [Strongylocentrotus purpuratus]|uniref:Uncharacterized protein n=1 Tax=Strongylocentrotus purpuratus TaxID=7668 RepID=A0A7M7SWV2_STRPU|nr:uncharacterized protein LOC105437632 [Strongylocentrotus purpuratus]|eukprot:XP_011662754.1 PREDICTED: uncharacterized protein LOC105437632 [Strongylocentrotus purpuratus]